MVTYFELKEKLSALLRQKERVVLVIDGHCAGGKTTLAEIIREDFDAEVIHMDHFFLQPHQRTEARLAEPGGNLDRERFLEEVVAPLKQGIPFSYRPYDCSKGDFAQAISICNNRLVVVEGSYSLHPSFGKYYDYSAFLFVPSLTQLERILNRPKALWDRFVHQWIPMEDAYFQAFSIPESCDCVLDGTEKR